MRIRTFWAVIAAALVLTVGALTQSRQGGGVELSRYVPEGAMLVLETEDFGQLLGDWNGSAEKTAWLASDNYSAFSRSKLFLRLGEAQKEFAAAAGVPADMALVDSIAGRESVVGVYDIGSLQFLYITRLSSAKAMESILWRKRADFEPRNAGSQAYYVRADTPSQREVAFATTDDYLFLATSGDVLARSLRLLAGEQAGSVVSAEWYGDASAARPDRGELRMVMNLQRLTATPHFRSYWIQRNVSDIRKHRAGVADLFRSDDEFREERTFLSTQESPEGEQTSAGTQAAAELLRYAPSEAGFYATRPVQGAQDAVSLIASKLLTPTATGNRRVRTAPRVFVGSGTTGSEGALETRIDQAPAAYTPGGLTEQALLEALESNPVLAALQVEESSRAVEDVFVGNRAVLVLRGTQEWNGEQMRSALQTAILGLWTTSRLGVEWSEQSVGAQTFHQLDGLTPLAVAVRGRDLFLANSPELLVNVLNANDQAAADAPVIHAAVFHRAREQANYETLMGHLDYLQYGRYRSQQNRVPDLFSENIASLGRALQRVESMSVRTTQGDDGHAANRCLSLSTMKICATFVLALLCIASSLVAGDLPGGGLETAVASAARQANISPRRVSWLLMDPVTDAVIDSRWNDPTTVIPPGSLVKPLAALAYAQGHDYRYPHYLCRGDETGCWLPTGHGELGVVDAIAHSCNSYFRELSKRLLPARIEGLARRFGLPPPLPDAPSESYLGLGAGWRVAPLRLAHGYHELLRRRHQPGVAPLLAGMRKACRIGTASSVGAKTGSMEMLAKTGTAPCTHRDLTPVADGDGFVILIGPADHPRHTLLMRVHGVPGLVAAEIAGSVWREFAGGGDLP